MPASGLGPLGRPVRHALALLLLRCGRRVVLLLLLALLDVGLAEAAGGVVGLVEFLGASGDPRQAPADIRLTVLELQGGNPAGDVEVVAPGDPAHGVGAAAAAVARVLHGVVARPSVGNVLAA